MRRLNLNKKSRSALNRESGAGISPGAIIARAAATVPENQDSEDSLFAARADTPVSGVPSGRPAPIEPPVRKNRRARRRPLRVVAEQIRGRGRLIGRVALLLALFGFPVWLWTSGRLDSAVTIVDQSTTSAGEDFRAALGLRLEHIYVAGRQRTSRRAISAILGLDRGASLTGIDIVRLRERLRALPWIKDVAIERRWPNVLFLRVREHTAIARFIRDGGVQLVSRAGTVIGIDAAGRYSHLLKVGGPGAPAKAGELLALLRTQPGLSNRVVQATRVGKRRWDLRFDNGAYLKLPERRPDAAWARFARLDKSHKLLAKGALGFDMRTRFDFVIRRPGGLSTDDGDGDKKSRATGKSGNRKGARAPGGSQGRSLGRSPGRSSGRTASRRQRG